MSGLGKFDNPAEIEKFLGPGESGFVHLLGRYPGVIQGRTVIPVPGILLDHSQAARRAGRGEAPRYVSECGSGPALGDPGLERGIADNVVSLRELHVPNGTGRLPKVSPPLPILDN